MEDKRTIIFMIVIGFLFILSMWYFQPKRDDIEKENIEKKQNGENKNIQKEETLEVKDNLSGQYELIEIPQEHEYNLTFENKIIKVEFDPNDAIIKYAGYKNDTLNPKDKSIEDIVIAKNEDGALKVKLGSWDNDLSISKLTGGNNLYHYKREGNIFIFNCKLKKKNEDNIYNIIKKYEFIDDQNVFKMDLEIYNENNQPISFDNSGIAYSVGWGPNLGVISGSKIINKRQKNVFTFLKGNKAIDVDSMGDSIVINSSNAFFNKTKIKNKFTLWDKKGDSSWLSSNGHYFTSILFTNDINYKYFFDYRQKDTDKFYCGLSRDVRLSKVTTSIYIYIGPKIKSVLKNADIFMQEKENIKDVNFEKIQKPIFWGIGNIISWFLDQIYKLVKNYGLSIIILTIIIKIILFPLTYKSMESQQKMSKLQPKIKELQEKYKDKPELLNKETMNLYKKEKINPLGGCLPMLLQMPILFAMYDLLNKMVQLKGATFLWVKDLSQPDIVYSFNFTIPLLNVSSLHILPFIMIAVQILSSMMMPGSQSNKQAAIMMWSMTVFFFFIFYNASAGLVLYWTIMNILNLFQQIYMNEKQKKLQNV